MLWASEYESLKFLEEDKQAFRYDNAKHHSEIKNFPHHKHVKSRVVPSAEKSLILDLNNIFQR
ncbi:MAG: DUF6516 family protein [Methanobacteriota archaeon]